MQEEDLVSVQLHIGGMTCVHCQEKIESGLAAEEGVAQASVSYRTGRAEVSYHAEITSPERLEQVVKELGYEVVRPKEKKPYALVYPLLVLAVIVALYALLEITGALNYLAPSSLADSTMGYGMLFVIGLVTSVHCIAMCGGINLSQCLPRAPSQRTNGEAAQRFQESEEVAPGQAQTVQTADFAEAPQEEGIAAVRTEGKPKALAAFAPALLYNAGRVLSYTLIGFVLGCIGWAAGGGSTVGIPAIVQGVLKVVAGLLMIVMGVNMLGIIPVLRKLNPTLPKFIAKRVGRKKATSKRPFVVGILNGVMPCGPLQSMWLVALATGSPLGGALSMFLFSVGTVPLMLGLGSFVAKLGQKFTKTVMTAGSVLVVVLGLAMLSQGVNLTGLLSAQVLSVVVLTLIGVGVLFSLAIENGVIRILTHVIACGMVVVVGAYLYTHNLAVGSYDVSVVEGDKQTVRSVLDYGSYPNISVKKGIPVEWTIVAEEGTITGCNYKMIIAEYDIEYVFVTGENLIEFTPEKAGSFTYNCWMGMIYATILVTE